MLAVYRGRFKARSQQALPDLDETGRRRTESEEVRCEDAVSEGETGWPTDMTPKNQKKRACTSCADPSFLLVELIGIEPTTYALRTHRSPN